jgi:hypothetical protein
VKRKLREPVEIAAKPRAYTFDLAMQISANRASSQPTLIAMNAKKEVRKTPYKLLP